MVNVIVLFLFLQYRLYTVQKVADQFSDVNLEHLHEFKSEQCLQVQGQFTKWLIDFLEEGFDVLDSPTEYFYWSPRQPKVRGYLATFYHCI